MNYLQRTFFFIMFLIPTSVFAHGQEVLETFFIEVVSIILFLIFIIAIRFDLKRKMVLAGAYMLSSAATLYFTNSLPYRENMNKINLMIAFVPATIFFVTFLVLKSRPDGHINTTKE
ncbi:MAG: hypothetical protein H7Y13_01280 [Sphingobacteriaceae bacterium]|nr:hypothetical protein [Sphingobacteriaceae bacterium]